MQDPNWNVAAIANTSGDVQERYSYTAYGSPTVLTSAFGGRGSTNYAWDALYTGRQYDPETGLYYYRNRYHGTELGRFLGRDPVGARGRGENLYQYVGDHPMSMSDPSGTTTVEYGRWWDIGSADLVYRLRERTLLT